MDLKYLIEEEKHHLKHLSELVEKSVKEEQLLTSRLIAVEDEIKPSFGQRLADRVAEFGGSWTFIIVFFSVLLFWIFLNIWFLNENRFDPYPFILLNLVLSCIAAIQAPVIMMSQNRREEKDRRRAKSDYMINLKAEIEIRSLHSKIDLLIVEQMKSLFTSHQEQLKILKKIENSLEKN